MAGFPPPWWLWRLFSNPIYALLGRFWSNRANSKGVNFLCQHLAGINLASILSTWLRASFSLERQISCFWKWISPCFFKWKLCWLCHSQVTISCAGCHLQVAISCAQKSFKKATHKNVDDIDPWTNCDHTPSLSRNFFIFEFSLFWPFSFSRCQQRQDSNL